MAKLKISLLNPSDKSENYSFNLETSINQQLEMLPTTLCPGKNELKNRRSRKVLTKKHQQPKLVRKNRTSALEQAKLPRMPSQLEISLIWLTFLGTSSKKSLRCLRVAPRESRRSRERS